MRASARREAAEHKGQVERELKIAADEADALRKDIEVERATHEMTLQKIQEEIALAKTQMESDLAGAQAAIAHDNETQADRLAREAAQARADLEVELAARRAEAEKALLEAHQKAVQQNARYLTEAKERLATVKKSLTEAKKTQKAVEKDIAGLASSGRAEAEAAAKGILSAAEEKAATLVRDAETRAAATLKDSREKLVELRAERDAIAEYIESLRAVVGEMTQKAPATRTTARKPPAKRAPAKKAPAKRAPRRS